MKLKVYRDPDGEITHVAVFPDDAEVSPPVIGEVEDVDEASVLGYVTLQALNYRRTIVEMDAMVDDVKHAAYSIRTEAEYIMGKGGVTE